MRSRCVDLTDSGFQQAHATLFIRHRLGSRIEDPDMRSPATTLENVGRNRLISLALRLSLILGVALLSLGLTL